MAQAGSDFYQRFPDPSIPNPFLGLEMVGYVVRVARWYDWLGIGAVVVFSTVLILPRLFHDERLEWLAESIEFGLMALCVAAVTIAVAVAQ